MSQTIKPHGYVVDQQPFAEQLLTGRAKEQDVELVGPRRAAQPADQQSAGPVCRMAAISRVVFTVAMHKCGDVWPRR